MANLAYWERGAAEGIFPNKIRNGKIRAGSNNLPRLSATSVNLTRQRERPAKVF